MWKMKKRKERTKLKQKNIIIIIRERIIKNKRRKNNIKERGLSITNIHNYKEEKRLHPNT